MVVSLPFVSLGMAIRPLCLLACWSDSLGDFFCFSLSCSLRLEKRHNYLRKVAELAVQYFITNDKVNVTGLVVAGSADFKTELAQSDMFDPRLQTKVVKIADISYGGENGFNQAIEQCAEVLTNVKFVQEKKLISKYFDEISQVRAPPH